MKTASALFINTPHFTDADGFYEQLLDAHAGLSREESEALNARLILTLANQVGDAAILSACIATAHAAGTPAEQDRGISTR